MKDNIIAKIVLIVGSVLVLIITIIQEYSKGQGYTDPSMESGAFLGTLLRRIIELLIIVGIVTYVTKKIKKSSIDERNINKKHSTTKVIDDEKNKIEVIKLGFKEKNGFNLTNKNMYEMNQNQLEYYYKVGVKLS